MHAYTHLYLFLSIYIASSPPPSSPISVYLKNHEFSSTSPFLNQCHRGFILVFSLSICVSPFSDSEKSGSLSLIYLLICNQSLTVFVTTASQECFFFSVSLCQLMLDHLLPLMFFLNLLMWRPLHPVSLDPHARLFLPNMDVLILHRL